MATRWVEPVPEPAADRQASLAALIQKRQAGRANVFSALEAKYASYEEEEEVEIEFSTAAPSKKAKGKKAKGRKKAADEDPLADADFEALQAKMFGGKKQRQDKDKKSSHADLDELDDDAFAALQAKMFGNKAKK